MEGNRPHEWTHREIVPEPVDRGCNTAINPGLLEPPEAG